jgi:hypothetical protein
MKRIRFSLIIIAVGSTAAAILLIAAALYAGSFKFDFPLSLPFMSRKSEAASSLMLTESRELLRLATVEYLYKSVFPYDFIPEGTDFRYLFSALFRNQLLSPEEEELIEIYRLCARIGIDLSMEQYRFAVISTRVKGGFDLSNGGIIAELLPTEKGEGKGVIISLPEPSITQLVIEDEVSEGYRYPDIEAGPADWKAITDLTGEMVRRKVLEEGILETAEERGKAYLEMLFSQAGYERIFFRTYPSKRE